MRAADCRPVFVWCVKINKAFGFNMTDCCHIKNGIIIYKIYILGGT